VDVDTAAKVGVMDYVQILDDRHRLGRDAMLGQHGRQVQHTALVRHPMVGGNEQLDIRNVVEQAAEGFVQDSQMPGRLRMVRPVGVHGVVGGGDEGQIVVFPKQGVAGRVDGPAVDFQGIDGRRLARCSDGLDSGLL